MRPLAAALVLAYAAAVVIGFVEQSAVLHVRCAEHGEVVHAGERAASNESDRNVASAPSGARMLSPSVDSGVDHEHCSVARLLEQRSSCARGATLNANVSAPEAAAFSSEASPPRSSRSVLTVAPKTSPPVA